MEGGDGISLAIGGTAVGSLVTLGCAWIKARCQKTKIDPNPLPVKEAKDLVSCDECRIHRENQRKINENLFARVAASEQGVAAANAKLDMIVSDTAVIKNKLMEK